MYEVCAFSERPASLGSPSYFPWPCSCSWRHAFFRLSRWRCCSVSPGLRNGSRRSADDRRGCVGRAVSCGRAGAAALRKDGALAVYARLSLFVFFTQIAAAGCLAALGFAPELSAGVFSRMTLCRELMVVYLSFAMLFVVLWRILGQIDQLRRRDAYRFSLEIGAGRRIRRSGVPCYGKKKRRTACPPPFSFVYFSSLPPHPHPQLPSSSSPHPHSSSCSTSTSSPKSIVSPQCGHSNMPSCRISSSSSTSSPQFGHSVW